MDFEKELCSLYPRLFAYAGSLSRDRHRAEDLVQTTMQRALECRKQFQAGTELSAWLHTILRHQFYNEYRKARRAPEDIDELQTQLMAPDDPERQLIAREGIGAALSLAPDKRNVLMLRASGVSYAEIAELVGTVEGTVKSRIFRACEELRAQA